MTTTTIKPISQPIKKDCCICGDLGLSYLLFRCQVCQFRYQHKYCSNEYPAAKFYRLCNWCISERDESSQKTHSSVNFSSSTKRSNTTNDDDYAARSNKRKNGNNSESVKKLPTKPIIVKKTPPEEGSPTLASRKRITTVSGSGSGGGGDGVNKEEKKLRRTESEKVESRGMIRKQVLRNKIRRYKSLEDVSC